MIGADERISVYGVSSILHGRELGRAVQEAMMSMLGGYMYVQDEKTGGRF